MTAVIIACTVVFLLCGPALCGCAFMLFRNQWVLKVRLALIDTNWAAYKTLPSYDHMMWRFWVWDIAAFLPEDGKVSHQVAS